MSYNPTEIPDLGCSLAMSWSRSSAAVEGNQLSALHFPLDLPPLLVYSSHSSPTQLQQLVGPLCY